MPDYGRFQACQRNFRLNVGLHKVVTRMQIPRGTFRTIIRGGNLPALVQKLKNCRFTGYCQSLHDNEMTLFVCDKGRIRLAEFGSLEGDEALEKILTASHWNSNAILHDLTYAQLRLALEFNPSFKTSMKNKTQKRQIQEVFNEGLNRPSDAIRIKTSGKSSLDARERAASFTHFSEREPGVQPAEKSRNSDQSTTLSQEDLLSKDLDLIESMDLENMTTKFRTSCIQIMERLDLDHLIEENSKK